MKKIFLFSVAIGLGLLTLSACTTNNKQPEAPVFNLLEEEAAVVEEFKLSDGSYLISPEDSQLAWYGKRLLGTDHSGLVKLKSGNFIVENELLVAGAFVIDMTSISSNDDNQQLVEHLKGPDFFDAEEYEEAKLMITSSEQSPEASLLIKADLSIKEITQPIEFLANIKEDGGIVIAMSDISIDRTRWDIRYGSGSFYKNLGNAAIDNEMGFKVYLEAEKQ